MRLEKDFEFMLAPKRKGVDLYDTIVQVRVIQTEDRCSVLWKTAEMQFSCSFESYNYSARMFRVFSSEISDIVKAFCKENVKEIMKYDDIACMNAAQFGFIGLCNPKFIEELKKFHRQMVSMLSIRLTCDFGLEPKPSRVAQDRANDYEYTSLTL